EVQLRQSANYHNLSLTRNTLDLNNGISGSISARASRARNFLVADKNSGAADGVSDPFRKVRKTPCDIDKLPSSVQSAGGCSASLSGVAFGAASSACRA